ncbi:MAG: hypothetical protein J6T53_03260 [Bacteroidales bacterium]|nr:hypothetical protein [Bacteroidales bacterium]
MKKILLAIALVLTMGFGAKAQFGLTDAFFNDWAQSDLMRTTTLINLPTDHGITEDVNAPLGSGLLVLTALGAGYAVARRKRD